MDRRQPPPRRRLKSGKILLRRRPVPCTIRNMSERGACLQVQNTAGIPAIFDFLRAGGPAARTCKTIWRDGTPIASSFNGNRAVCLTTRSSTLRSYWLAYALAAAVAMFVAGILVFRHVLGG